MDFVFPLVKIFICTSPATDAQVGACIFLFLDNVNTNISTP